MDICVRIKRKKATYFLLVHPSETVLELKQKIEEYSSKVRPVADEKIAKSTTCFMT